MAEISRVWKTLQLTIFLTLVFGLRFINLGDVLVGGRVYFIDADCYSRMTRVREVMAHPGRIVRSHDFENWPDGTVPHTTAPLDYLIAALAVALGPFSAQAADLAGALISPLFALATAGFLWFWCGGWQGERYRGMMLLLFAVSPGLIHATIFGRPDHQSLLLLLLAVALGAEWRLAARITRGWAIAAGVAWSLALWVSLFEPSILLALVLLLWLAGGRRALFTRERLTGFAVMGGILLLALMIEGWRVEGARVAGEKTTAWFGTIGELAGGWGLLRWVGWGALLTPWLLFWKPARDRRAAAFVLLAVAAVLSFSMMRWGYFFALAYAMSLPWQLQRLRPVWAVWLGALVLLWPVWRELDGPLPGHPGDPLRQEARTDQVSVRQAAEWLQTQPRGGVLAPWWQSPGLAYWSGQPMVAGSSHESLPGIEASARFFTTMDQTEARGILQARRVRYIVAYEADRMIETSAPLASRPALPEASMAFILYRTPRSAPPFLRHDYSSPVLKIFTVLADR